MAIGVDSIFVDGSGDCCGGAEGMSWVKILIAALIVLVILYLMYMILATQKGIKGMLETAGEKVKAANEWVMSKIPGLAPAAEPAKAQ